MKERRVGKEVWLNFFNSKINDITLPIFRALETTTTATARPQELATIAMRTPSGPPFFRLPPSS